MKLTRIYNDDTGESCFEDKGDIAFAAGGDLCEFSEIFQPADKLLFFRYEEGFTEPWHNPQVTPTYIVPMSGRLEIEVSSGEKRVFGKGDVLVLEHKDGKGHATVALEAGLNVVVIGE